jgi:iron complex transport system substrate-binding protein
MSSHSPGMAKSRAFSPVLWLVPIALLAALIWVFSAALSTPPLAPSKTNTVSGTDFPLTIEETNGNKVVIPALPRRIVAADAGTADVLAALVEPERIVAVPFTVLDFSGAAGFYQKHLEIAHFEKYQAETILAYKPDLILVLSFHDQATTSMLAQHNIPVLTFEAYKTFAGIRGFLGDIGRAVGNPSGGIALQTEFDARLAAVEKAVAGKPKPRVLSYSNYGNGFAVGIGESQDEIIRRAGGMNAAAEMNLSGHVSFTFEQLLKLNPDWLVVSGDNGLSSPQVKILLNEASLASLAVIKERRIAVVPDNVYSTISQHIVTAVEILARQIHPDAFPAPQDTKKSDSSSARP